MKAIFAILLFPILATAQPTVRNAFPGLTFDAPMDIQISKGVPDTLFIAERAGIIRRFHHTPDVSTSQIFLNISSHVTTSGEGGILGFAFHPNYPETGYVYVSYTRASPYRSVLSRFSTHSANPQSLDADSEVMLIVLNQPSTNHNGGQIRFGPDGYLYVAFGDGGGAGDPSNHAQNRTNLFGTILRLDVDQTQGSLEYAIPSDNPYVGNTSGWREEIFAYGLRNPFRFSFDSETGDLWAGDVGQGRLEEVNIIRSGGNYGWRIMEGTLCFNPTSGCDTSEKILPVYEYDIPGAQSITGGFVYRGENSDQTGRYFFGDYVSGQIWSIAYDGGPVANNLQLIGSINRFSLVCFGEDHQGELVLCSFDGGIYTIDMGEPVSVEKEPEIPAMIKLDQNFPNPFNPNTVIRFRLSVFGDVNLSVHDMLGRKISTLVDRRMPAGEHQVWFDASYLPSGVYLYQLSIGGTVLTNKMMLIK